MDIRVMTFNLRMNTPDDGENAWPHRSDKAAQVIKDHDPLIVGTQEGFHSMLEDLRSELPYYEVIGEGRAGGTKDEYSAILYQKEKVKQMETGQFWLSETPDIVESSDWGSACPRICTWASFSFVDEPEKTFAAFNTHLDHVSQEAREKGIELVLAKMKEFSDKGIPVVLTGDFNVEPSNPVVAQIEQAGLKRAVTEGRTFHNFKGGTTGEPIDYIFTSEAVQLKEVHVEQEAIDGTYPSDHYPVVAKVTI